MTGQRPSGGVGVCPFVAFEDDRGRRSDEPDARHRCFAPATPLVPALDHQANYCLASAFPACPIFQDWARQQTARPVDAGPARSYTRPPPEVAGAAVPAAGAAARPVEPGARPAQPALPVDELTERGSTAPLLRPGGRFGPGTAQGNRRPQREGDRLGDGGTPRWERPRRSEAYPSIRRRVGMGGVSRTLLALVGLLVAALAFLFLPTLLFGPARSPGPPATVTAPPSSAASPTGSGASAAPGQETYTVAAGDTMRRIARKFGLTIAQLQAANPQIKDPNQIKIGDRLKIPSPDSSVSPASSGGSGSAAP